MKESTLGLLETYGFVGAVEGLDVALKSANVKLVSCEFVTGGIVTILITGDVASVKASIEAASVAVDRLGSLRNGHVIARAEESVWNILDGKKKDSSKKTDEISVSDKILTTKVESENADNDVKDTVDSIEEEKLDTVDEIQESEDDSIAIEDKKDIKLRFENREELEALKVPELRTIARELKERKNLSLTKKQIKFSKKDQLIEAILKEQ
ncbi:BMC domain protein [Clostridium argentinense CDC 2741]|uniref:BMC domain protein n=1 Tax=Clostridium argentinense CDC 2741 TaxID=1418104 RepID=A0A0C1U579_9CLOT|nr:BMC domain-containing protein [Clostridium argentinense]ARC85458.1 BMC domain-containing protein [Clostridium argentinense]KIE46868.1 BMC domain protein [Clostridium argentinense CDC 2741]NFF39970.1 BMC domain-containing protein [Clostridium argentinense]NFP50333.1 BMC domain-containing protein [Clostridium argentinense]NFP71974.1 BMC domain-containing protein [Clostridium argentinense]